VVKFSDVILTMWESRGTVRLARRLTPRLRLE
jgi:hypothetical protein